MFLEDLGEDDYWLEVLKSLQDYVEKAIELSRKEPEKLRRLIEEYSGVDDYELMLLRDIWPNVLTNTTDELCNVIALSTDKYRHIRNYIRSLINRVENEINRPDRPHFRGYLREVLSQLYEVLSRVHRCAGKELEHVRAKADALKFRGLALKIQGHYDKAIKLFKKAINVLTNYLEEKKDKDTINHEVMYTLAQDLSYLTALKCETLGQRYLYTGDLERAIMLFKLAGIHYHLANDETSYSWVYGHAYALEGLLELIRGNGDRALKIMSYVYSDIHPRIEKTITRLLSERTTTLDRLFAASLISLVSRIAHNYWQLLSTAYELLLNTYYQYQGYTLLPRMVRINHADKEVDLNAIKYQEKTVLHIIGECKMTLNINDVKKFARKVNIISDYIKNNPVLCPKSYKYRLKILVIANFSVSKIRKKKVESILRQYLKEDIRKSEVEVYDIKELENKFKEVLPELALHSTIKTR